jgi:tetratricopeptide (TPR) repeat protein
MAEGAKVDELVKVLGSLSAVQGVEKELQERRWRGVLAGVGAVASQIVVLAASKDYLPRLGHFFVNLFTLRWHKLLGGPPDGLDGYQLLALVVLVGGGVAWTVLRNTQVLLAKSSEPFRYSFSVERFTSIQPAAVGSAPAAADDGEWGRLHLDLIERLSRKHQRLSLLDPNALPAAEQKRLQSHIHISGHVVRSVASHDGRTEAEIKVMARVRIGPPGQPERVVDPVVATSGCPDVLEQLQAHIEKTMYAQIRSDIRKKIRLFPTSFRRAAGLFCEAEDFEKSNTIHAFDNALSLYREALDYFDLGWTRRLSWFLVGASTRRTRLVEARARVAYSRCLVFRRLVSATAGRRQLPVYELHEQLDKNALPRLNELYDQVSPRSRRSAVMSRAFELSAQFLTHSARPHAGMRSRQFVESCREAFFEALVVSSLACGLLEEYERSQEQLRLALAIAPDRAEESALYLLAQSRLQPEIIQKQHLLEKAKEYAPRSETIQYSYASVLRARFLRRNDLTRARAESVVDAFESVQGLNPGNIAAYAACAYVWWLVGDLSHAEEKYQQGIAIKAIQEDTFIGELNYGLARIAAEHGDFDRAYDLYQRAIDANPSLAASSSDTSLTDEVYPFMTSSTLARYRRFLQEVRDRGAEHARAREQGAIVAGKAPPPPPSERTSKTVLGFALNDCACACFNYYMRTGMRGALTDTIELLEEARAAAPNIAAVEFNLSSAYYWTSDPERQIDALERAARLAPSWTPWLMELIERYLDKRNEKNELDQRLARHRVLDSNFKVLMSRHDDLKRALDRLPGNRLLREHKKALELLAGTMPSPEEEKAPASSGAPEAQADHHAPDEPAQQEDSPATQAERDRIGQELAELAQETEKVTLELARLSPAEDKKSSEDIAATESRFKPLFGTILRSSRFAGFFSHLDVEARDARSWCPDMKKLLEEGLEEIEVAHVGDDFVDLLRLLARALSWQPESVDMSEQLYRYICKQFSHEDFVSHRRLLELYGPPTAGESADKPEDRCASIRVVQSTIEAELRGDPIRWLLLDDWARAYWEFEVAHLGATKESDLLAYLESIDSVTEGSLQERWASRITAAGLKLSRQVTILKEGPSRWRLSDRGNGRTFRILYWKKKKVIVVQFGSPTLEGTLKSAIESHVDGLVGAERAILHRMLAKQYEDLDEHARAIEQFELATAQAPTDGQHWLALARCHLDARDSEKAYGACWRAIPYEPVEAVALLEQIRVRRFEPLEADVGITPILVEIGNKLVPLVDPAQDGGHFLKERVEPMREAIGRELGINIPGIQFRGSGAPDDSYLFMVHEVPLARGTISGTEKPGPGRDEPDPATALFDRVRALLREHVALIWGVQEADALLREWRTDADCAAMVDNLRGDPKTIVTFARVLRALLSEQIPLVDRRTILRTMKELGVGRDTVPALVQALRVRLKNSIPGNAADVDRISLPPELAPCFAPPLHPWGAAGPLLEPRNLHEIILKFDAFLEARGATGAHRTAIVVDDSRQRILAKRALESSFPAVMWLSRGELVEEVR